MLLTANPRVRISPFHEAVVAAGVTHASVYNHMVLPFSFGDPEAEYKRLTEGVALWDVAAERQVEVRGPDADACVQYLTARDLSKMKYGQGKYVAICDHDGRILNDPVLLKLSDRYWFSIADSDVLLWTKAIAAEKGFDVTVVEPDVSPLAVQGPLADQLVVDLFGPHVATLKFFRFIETQLNGIPLVLCRSGWSKQGGFELFLRDGSRGVELWNLVAEAGAKYGIGPGAPNAVERIESGLLSYGGDTAPDSNPFEVGMAPYVDLDTPADYIGKAALQRIAAAGPKRLLVGLTISTEADETSAWPLFERSAVLADGSPVGTMSSVAYSPRVGSIIGIAQVARPVVEAGQPVEVVTPGGSRPAVITELPFL